MASDEERIGMHRELAKLGEGFSGIKQSIDNLRNDMVNWQVSHRQEHIDLEKTVSELKNKPTLSLWDLGRIAGVIFAGVVAIAIAIAQQGN